ncbi:MAG: 50S ribosomal protein L28 [Candidatus Omnitrophica bacterium]|nr:50S ribosomal protein L28 [Candidatus Omnitrophota bacterium]
MSRVCYFTGKKPRSGKKIARRGIAKKSGGIGLKTTGITTRRFLPNLQSVKIIENGTVKRVRVAASYLTSGKVVRAPKRTWKKATASPEAQVQSTQSH